jgi:hypothetical protein
MNPRIRLLAEQAGSTHKQNLGVYQFYEHELLDFVQSIVQESLNVLHDNELYNRHISHVLQEHFGVEE